MADQVDSMSDAELRTKLAEHGFPVMPITASTRKLLVKKLKLVLENKCKPRNNADNRRSLAKYSSGEDSDLETKTAKEKTKRRTTVGGAMLPPAASRVRRPTPKKDSPVKNDSDKGSESDSEQQSPIKTHEEVETVTTRRVTRLYKPITEHEEYETGSDSEVDNDKKTSIPFRSNSRSSDYISSTLPSSSTRHSPLKPPVLSSRPSMPSSVYSSGTSNPESLSSIRARLGLTSVFPDKPSLGSNYSSSYNSDYKTDYKIDKTSTDEAESPYLSNFTRRLSAFKSEPRTSFRDLADSKNGSTPSFAGKSYFSRPRSNIPDFRSVGEKKIMKNNVVSLTLLGILALFFIVLGFTYLGMKSDVSFILEDKSNIIPMCQTNIPGNEPGVKCVPKDQVSHAMNLLKLLYPELTKRATSVKCGEKTSVPYMTDQDVLHFASRQGRNDDLHQIRTDLNNLHVLIMNNPKWGISLIEVRNIYNQEIEQNALYSMDDVIRKRNKNLLALAVAETSMPIRCFLFNTLYSAGLLVFLFGLTLCLIWGIYRAVKYYMAVSKRRNDEIYSMVEQIIDLLSQECNGDDGDSFLPVNHIRDMLISPQNREKMSSVWEAAIKFLQKNESRVRFEVQTVDGDDFKVIRWMSPASGSPRRSGNAWQGQAFETQEGSVNSLSVSPTPCLKIRHMVDKNDANQALRTVIQDAILEKCGDQCNILHVEVDRISCCVYVKCASQKDAGIVYKSLHGWWYDGKLITVKYLRLERYMERFPSSPSVGPYLKPSGQMYKSSWEE